jgi:hypothetical protein
MIIVAKFETDKGLPLLEFPFTVDSPGDVESGARDAFAEFRRVYPDVSLFNVVVRFSQQ